MTDKLTITGKVEAAGWSWLEFNCSGLSHSVIFSYIFSNGLDNILTAVSLLNKGLQVSEAHLTDEPGDHILHFTKTNSENVTIRLYTFEEWSGALLANRQNLPEPKFIIETTLKRLTLQILNLFDQFKKEYGLEGYNERWRSEYPLDRIEKLKVYLKTQKTLKNP